MIKRKTPAETEFESILQKLRLAYVFQAGFLSEKSFSIADFYIKSPYKLIIEIDGDNHLQQNRMFYRLGKK